MSLKPIETAEDWAKKYDLEIKSIICPECNQVFWTTEPIVRKGFRGLEIPNHGCSVTSAYTGRYFNESGDDLWKSVIELILERRQKFDI
jgi:hypothetical protein